MSSESSVLLVCIYENWYFVLETKPNKQKTSICTPCEVKVLVAQSCPTVCTPMDCNPSGSSADGILQARTLEQVVISFSRGSSWPRDQTQVSWIAGRFFTVWATREAPYTLQRSLYLSRANSRSTSSTVIGGLCCALLYISLLYIIYVLGLFVFLRKHHMAQK